MKFTLPKQHSGFSLMELLLVLAVAAMLIFLGINRYQQSKLVAETNIVQQNINLLFNALNLYYYQYCRSNSSFSDIVSMKELDQHNLLPPLVKTRLLKPMGNGYDYEVQAILIGQSAITQKPLYQLSIRANLNVQANSVGYYQQMLGAKSANNSVLTWVRLPTYSIPTVSSNGWIAGVGLRYFKESMIGANNIQDLSCGY